MPVSIQVELLSRLLWYERGLQRDGTEGVQVLILTRAGQAESLRAAAQLESQFDDVGKLGGKSITSERLAFKSLEQVRQAVLSSHAYMLYLTPGLEEVVEGLAHNLAGQRVLTVSALGTDVASGAVLGFELVSSKPRIVLNLSQARKQDLDFSAQLLRIVRVVQ